MPRKLLLLALVLGTVVEAAAQQRPQRLLITLFDKAENCYLMDDYEQLDHCIAQYRSLLDSRADELGDSLDVFQAYLDKMLGCWLYGQKGDSAAMAEHHYRQSMMVFRKRVATTGLAGMHLNEATLHEELAQLYYKLCRYDEADAQTDTVVGYWAAHRFTDEGERHYWQACSQKAMCQARLGRFAEALALMDDVLQHMADKPQESDRGEALRKRAKILMMQADSEGTADYDEARTCYEQYLQQQYKTIAQQLRYMDANQRAQYWLATHRFLYDCFRLGNHAPGMLYDLALFSKGYLLAYERNHKVKRYQWQQVQQQLGSDDCAVEFVQYFGRNDQKRMGCLVIRLDSPQPQFVDLFATDSVLNIKLSSAFGISVRSAVMGTKPKDSIDKRKLYEESDIPSRLVWSPRLMQAIGSATNIYFAPDGMFNVLGIEYLMRDSTKTCYRLSSTRNLCQKRRSPQLAKALLCGGIPYSVQPSPIVTGNDEVAYRHLARKKITIPDLKNSIKEIRGVDSLRHNPHDTVLVGAKATDEHFLSLLRKRYQLVMLSTHGFYHGDIRLDCDVKPLLRDQSMSQSGIMFAGVQTALSDEQFDSSLNDGVLSAAELSQQDLSSVELTVLSACETGLGRLTDDGLYGLARGLKLAGAQALVLSLWEVSDASSALFMQLFMDNLQHQRVKNIHEAFFTARRQLAERGYSAPYHTCPFILLDAL